MTVFASIVLFAAMSPADAVVTLLNSPSSTSPACYAEAEQILRSGAKDGNPVYRFVLGVTSKEPAKAQEYLDTSRDKIREMAEKKNNPLAWYLLSMEKNDLRLLKKAVAGGNVQALNAYGALVIQTAIDRNAASNVLEKAFQEGYRCFSQAVQHKDPNGYVNLGTCYLKGFGCKVDLKRAHACFLRAAEAGHPEAMDYLSANYELGHGVERDLNLSLYWSMRAKAERGDRAASEWLKSCRRNGSAETTANQERNPPDGANSDDR